MSHNGLLNHKIDCMKDVFVLFIIKVIRPIRPITDFSNRNVEDIHWSATDILNEVLPLKPPSNYKWRNQPEFTVRPIKTVHYGLNSLSYLGPRIWELLPNNLKRLESVEAFKSEIKGWKVPENICTKWALYRFISRGFNLFI